MKKVTIQHFVRNIVLLFVLIIWMTGLQAQDYALDWNHEIQVGSGMEKIDKEELYAYNTVVHEAKEAAVRKLILDEVKLYTSEKATKKSISKGLKVDFPQFDGRDINVKVKTDPIKKTDDVRLYAAFMADGKAINPTDFPEADKQAKEVMKNTGIRLNQLVVSSQVVEAEEELAKRTKTHEGLVADVEKLEKKLVDYQNDINSLEAKKRKTDEKIIDAQGKAASLKVIADAATATSKDLNKYSKAQKKATDLESDALKINQKILETQNDITTGQTELDNLKKEIEMAQQAVDKQSEIVAKLKAKHDAIQ